MTRRPFPPILALAVIAVCAASSPSVAQELGPRVAVQRLPAALPSVATVDVSANGRFVAFVSAARLDAADLNAVSDVYVLDRASGRISLESVALDGGAGDGSSEHPRLSGDGRYLVFTSVATNLAPGPGGPGRSQVFRRDRDSGTTVLASHTPANTPGNGRSRAPEVSDDGRFVAFESTATDLVAGPDANDGGTDIYLFDAMLDAVSRVSLTTAGRQPAIGSSRTPAISATGRWVVFESTSALDPEDVPDRRAPVRAVFLHDVSSGTTRLVSRTRHGRDPNGPSYQPAISGDGRRVAFVSAATDLGDGHRTSPRPRLYLYEAESARLSLVSRNAQGGSTDGASDHPALSADGRFVVFSSNASNLMCVRRCPVDREDVNLVSDVYRLDTRSGLTERVSGAEAGRPWWAQSAGPAVDATGGVIAFSSQHPIDDQDVGHDDDLFFAVLPDPPESAARPHHRATSDVPAIRSWSGQNHGLDGPRSSRSGRNRPTM